MATLYEIDEAIVAYIDTETGEIIDEAALEDLKMERAEKIKNIALLIKNLRADAASYKAEEDAFKARREAAENKANNLKEYLQRHLNGEKIKDAKFEISYRTSKATDIFDENAIPIDYKKWSAPTIDKQQVLRALKEGAVIPGARLVERVNMSIK